MRLLSWLRDYFSIPRTLYWVQDDADGFSWERNDCTVIAWAIANEVPYREAWLTMAAPGRPIRDGFFGYGNPSKGLTGKCLCGQPLKYILPKMRSGHWIVWIEVCPKNDHVFAIKNGIVYDTFAPNPEKTVKGYWRIK